MGRLKGVIVDIKGASALADFEVIEIVDERNPYPMIIGINLATDMNGVINLKKEKDDIWEEITPCSGATTPCRRTVLYKLVHDYESDDDLDYIYKIMVQDQDWVNLTEDKRISWDHESSYTLDLDEELEHWQNRLHEVSTLRCR